MAEYDLVRGSNRIVFSRFTPPPKKKKPNWDGMGELSLATATIAATEVGPL